NAGTAIATGGYVPEVESKSAEERERILQGWVKKNRQLISAVDAWQDADLDTLVLPHPLLGNMTLREILLFTVYHNMHHVNDVQRVRVESETEWF
ncbi:MAG: DinB family protein, partial [Anaerolineae bacterium]